MNPFFTSQSALWRHLVLALSGAVWLPALCAERMDSCPPEMPASPVQWTRIPDGWTPFTASALLRSGAGFASGPPGPKADLIPYSVDQRKHKSVAAWKFAPHAFPDRLRPVCCYGRGGEAARSRKSDRRLAPCASG